MKKILILTATAGNGHNACAAAMKARLDREEGVEVELVNLLISYSDKLNCWVSDKGYNFAVGKALPIYNAFFEHYKKRAPARRYSTPCQKACLTTVEGLLQKILSFRPDAIYCTHYDAAVALTDLRLVFPIPPIVLIANLDYVYAPFWESTVGVDYFVIPNEDFIEEGLQKGFRKEQLLPWGLPVKEVLGPEGNTRAERKAAIGLEDKFTVCIMFGGGHWRGVYRIYRMVERALEGRDAQIIMICGRNKSAYKKVEKRKTGVFVKNVGYTTEVPSLLHASDMVINKSGGTGVTEMLDAGLPMLIYEKTPSQEQYNLRYLKEKGVALSFRNEQTLRQGLYALMDDAALRTAMAENAKALDRNASAAIAQLLISAPTADYSALEACDLTHVKKRVTKAVHAADKAAKKGM